MAVKAVSKDKWPPNSHNLNPLDYWIKGHVNGCMQWRGQENISGMALGIPGLVDGKRGIVFSSPHFPKWKGVPLKERLAEKISIPIVMDNDAARVEDTRRQLVTLDPERRATIIGGEPKRMLHKLAGPFDLIYDAVADPAMRAALEKLLAPDGVLVSA